MAAEKPRSEQDAETIDTPTAAKPKPFEPADELPPKIPEKIGHYRIKRVIAAGGMGVVYEAVQEHPRRTVALKIMKQGIASRSALRRFEYESQILARLKHPGIAQVYEAGMHDDGSGGVPFFAMEYVAGAKDLHEYAKAKDMSFRERLELFDKVCDAVHHGHQKGIIHRDLKPANILVDSTGQPKIIDFGVARATDSDLAVPTLQTDVGQLVGTVQYMSPEQIEADPHDIDTRSDVYALGVILYKLLTDRLPYDVSGTVIYEATRMVREEQPKRISTIDRTLRGDVETIVLHALEKDRDRRYQSAVELAQDIERYLSNRPIHARPPSVAYHFRTFVRRNKLLVGAVAAVFVALVLGVIGTSWQSHVAAMQRDRAERRFQQVRELSRTFMFDFHDKIQRLDGAMPARELLVETALKYLDGLAQDVSDNPELQREVASAYDRVGDIRGGSRNPSLGDIDGGLENYRTALAMRRALAEKDPKDAALRKEISASLLRIADMLEAKGDIAGEEAACREAVEIREALVKEDPAYRRLLAFALNSLGGVLGRTGRLREAKRQHERALAIGKEVLGEPADQETTWMYERDVAVAYGKIGGVLLEMGEPELALARYEENLEIRQRLLREQPNSGRAERDLAIAEFFTGKALLELGKPAEAKTHLDRFLAVAEQKINENPEDARSKRDLAAAYEIVGRAEAALGQLTDAQRNYDQFHALIVSLSESAPENSQYRTLVAQSHERLGQVSGASGDADAASRHYREALSIIDDLVADDPGNFERKTYQAELLCGLGELLVETDGAEARRRLERARDLFETLRDEQPDRAALRTGLDKTRDALSRLD